MGLFTKKPDTVEAYRVTAETAPQLVDWINSTGAMSVYYDELPATEESPGRLGSIRVMNEGKETRTAHLGDWICYDKVSGGFGVSTNEEFLNRYEPVN